MGSNISQILERLRTGDAGAVDQLTPTLYSELRHIAARHLRGEREGHTLQPTALVHEAYLKLMGSEQGSFVDRSHFLAVASRVMRHILVDYARARVSQKRGSNLVAPLGDADIDVKDGHRTDLADIVELDAALTALAAESESKAKLIEMRFFGGMTAEESAEALGMSVHVVRHELRFAQAWLRRRLSP